MERFQNVVNGTHGAVWLDDEKVMEVKAFQAKDEYKKEEIKRCGTMNVGYKITEVTGKGSMTINKVNSRLIKKLALEVRMTGKTPLFTVIAGLADPDAKGAERIAFYNVVFDDLTLFDFEVAKPGEIEAPFTYEYYDLLDVM